MIMEVGTTTSMIITKKNCFGSELKYRIIYSSMRLDSNELQKSLLLVNKNIPCEFR